MQGARGCPAPERAGWRMGEGERGATPFRYAPLLLRGVTPQLWSLGSLPRRVEGVCVRARAGGWGERAGDPGTGYAGPGDRRWHSSPRSSVPIWGAGGSALVSFKGLVEDQCALFFVFCVLQVGPWIWRCRCFSEPVYVCSGEGMCVLCVDEGGV